MPVQKRSKGSSKSKKPSHLRMRGGDLSEKMVEYLKSKGITELSETNPAGYDFTTLDDETAKEMFNVDENDYQNWSNVKSYPVEDDEEEEEETDGAAAEAVAAPADEEPAAVEDGVATADEEPAAVEDGAAEEIPKYTAVVCALPPRPPSQTKMGGSKTSKKYKHRGGAVYTKICTVETLKSAIDATTKVFNTTEDSSGKQTYEVIQSFAYVKYVFSNPTIKFFDNNVKSLSELNRDTLLKLLSNSTTIVQNMVFVLEQYKDEDNINGLVNTAIVNTYKKVYGDIRDTTIGKEISRFFGRGKKATAKELAAADAAAAAAPEALAANGGKRTSKSRRGGFLDTTRIYNAQGLLSDAVDPLTAASTAGAEVERVPLPFSSRGSGTINYESDINKDFIADLLPSLGKSGGAKKSKKTRK
jgi:hypothetical protein